MPAVSRFELLFGLLLRHYRSLELVAFHDTNKVNAEFKGGILRVALGKRVEARAKRVQAKVK